MPAIGTAEVPTTATAFMPQATPTQTVGREAQVLSVEIQIKNNSPAQVKAVVRGNLTESCATLGESQVQYASNVFRITFYVVHPADMACAQVTTSFETTIPLNVNGLPADKYTVVANGVSAVFTLPVETATPSPTSTIAPVNITCTDAADPNNRVQKQC